MDAPDRSLRWGYTVAWAKLFPPPPPPRKKITDMPPLPLRGLQLIWEVCLADMAHYCAVSLIRLR